MAIGNWGPDIEVRNNSMNKKEGLINKASANISSKWLSIKRVCYVI